jgi:hypothetical protein
MAFQLFGIKGKTDEHFIGSITASYKVDTLLEAMFTRITPPEDVPFPEKPGGRVFEQWKGGGYLLNVTFEGQTGDQNNFTYPDGLDFQWTFDSSFAEQRIEKHPNIKALIVKYGGRVEDDGTIVWPLQLPTATARGGFGGSTAVADPDGKNPMFGNQTYPEWAAVFRMTKTVRTLPGDILTRIGKIRKKLPVPGALTPEGRDWLVMPPHVTGRGDVKVITDEWLISPPGGGWPPDIHDFLR